MKMEELLDMANYREEWGKVKTRLSNRRSSLEVAGKFDPAIWASDEDETCSQENASNRKKAGWFDRFRIIGVQYNKAKGAAKASERRSHKAGPSGIHAHFPASRGPRKLSSTQQGTLYQKSIWQSKKTEIKLEELIKEFNERHGHLSEHLVKYPTRSHNGDEQYNPNHDTNPQDVANWETASDSFVIKKSNRWLPCYIPKFFKFIPEFLSISQRGLSQDSSVSTSCSDHMFASTSVDDGKYEWNRRCAAKHERVLRKLNREFFGSDMALSSTSIDHRKSHVRFSDDASPFPPLPLINPPKIRPRSIFCCFRREDSPHLPRSGSILKSNHLSRTGSENSEQIGVERITDTQSKDTIGEEGATPIPRQETYSIHGEGGLTGSSTED